MIFKELAPKTKQMIIICVTLIAVALIIVAGVTGTFDILLGIIGGIGK